MLLLSLYLTSLPLSPSVGGAGKPHPRLSLCFLCLHQSSWTLLEKKELHNYAIRSRLDPWAWTSHELSCARQDCRLVSLVGSRPASPTRLCLLSPAQATLHPSQTISHSYFTRKIGKALQSLHDQVCHLSGSTEFSALFLLTLRSHLRANLTPGTPSSVFLVKSFAPVMNDLPFSPPFYWSSSTQIYNNVVESLLSNSLWPHVLQHTRLLCHHSLPELAQTHVLWVHDTIQPSHPLSPPSPPPLNLSQHQRLFQ